MANQSELMQVDKYAPETEVHKYLHSRLASFDTASLYELHYQMITLGKVMLPPCCMVLSSPRPLLTHSPSQAHGQLLLSNCIFTEGHVWVHAMPTPLVNQKQTPLQESLCQRSGDQLLHASCCMTPVVAVSPAWNVMLLLIDMLLFYRHDMCVFEFMINTCNCVGIDCDAWHLGFQVL